MYTVIIRFAEYLNLYYNALIALECEVIPGNLKQIDAGIGILGGVNDDNELFLFLGNNFRKINANMKHFTVGPAGELGINSSNTVLKFQSGQFSSIPGKKKSYMLKKKDD